MGEKLTFLAGIEPVLHMYVKKKSFLVGSNHKNVAIHCMKSSALPTTLSGHTCMLVIDS